MAQDSSTSTDLKRVALHDVHTALGAKLIPFAGYQMPVWYASQTAEHHAVREKVGMFDVSHMGEFSVKGEGAEDFLQYVTSNDVATLYDGRVQYSCLPNDKGGIVDDLLVYKMAENDYFLVVNASNIEKDWNWMMQHKPENVEMTNISDDISLFAVQGAVAIDALQSLTKTDLKEIPYYHFVKDKFAGVPNVIISNTGYTGAGGFEIYVNNENAVAVWEAILESGKQHGIIPVGLAARDTLRLEMGFCLYGNDINDTTSPLEAGLGWITKFNKKFINSEALERQKKEGITKKLIGFEVLDKGIARQFHKVFDAPTEGNQIGEVTSGTKSPSLGKSIGMAYVKKDFIKAGSEIFVEVREGKRMRAEVKKFPFLQK
ncbi:glycine cleavage system aminomethyltransferase GcvT [Bernardetia sp. ABR2-2B]|uniref:glycine cleavage system aminomethyltransferase GcvT n=1 Tax=Bernardetia sp. ABR2-2B TaxID=3127472 RepID=UPI0030CAD88F